MSEERFLKLLEDAWPERARAEEMTPRQRLLIALAGEQPDRVPVVLPGFHLYRWADASYDALLAQIAALADPVYDVFLNYDPIGCLAGAQISQQFWSDGTLVRTVPTPRGELREMVRPAPAGSVHQNRTRLWLENLADVERFLALPAEPRPRDVSDVEGLRDRLGEKALTIVTVCEPVEALQIMCGTTNFSLWYVDEPALLKNLLDVLFARIMGELAYWLRLGLAPVYRISGAELCLPPMTAPRVYRELCLPYERAMIELIHRHGCRAIIHSHSGISPALEAFAAAGADGSDPCEPPPLGDLNLADAKRRLAAVGSRMSLWGNIEYNLLAEGPAREVERQVRQAITSGGPGGGFVLLPCARLYESSLPSAMAPNLLTFLQTGRCYGHYPIVN